jgi:hypothetical protein
LRIVQLREHRVKLFGSFHPFYSRPRRAVEGGL